MHILAVAHQCAWVSHLSLYRFALKYAHNINRSECRSEEIMYCICAFAMPSWAAPKWVFFFSLTHLKVKKSIPKNWGLQFQKYKNKIKQLYSLWTYSSKFILECPKVIVKMHILIHVLNQRNLICSLTTFLCEMVMISECILDFTIIYPSQLSYPTCVQDKL